MQASGCVGHGCAHVVEPTNATIACATPTSQALAPRHMEVWVRELRDSIDDPDAVAMNAMLIAETVQETSMAMLARAHGAEPALLSAYQRWAPKVSGAPPSPNPLALLSLLDSQYFRGHMAFVLRRVYTHCVLLPGHNALAE
eukprot:1237720-Prymnesium_polylepis.1